MRRRVGLFLFCGLVLPLVVVANASAQTLELFPKSGPPGTEVTVNGAGFLASSATINSPQIRLNFRDAPVLRTASLTPQNTFESGTTFNIPLGTAPGEHLVIATQFSVKGRAANGNGRAKFRVTAGAAGAAAAPGGGTSQTVVVLGTLMVGLVLLASGTLAVRRLRTPNRPLGS